MSETMADLLARAEGASPVLTLAEMRKTVKTQGTRTARRSKQQTISDYHEQLNNKEYWYQRVRYREFRKQIDAVDRGHLPTIREMELYDRIRCYFDRNKFLPRSYREWLKKLGKGLHINQIIPKQEDWL